MKKRYHHIDLAPELQSFRNNFLAATEIEATLCGITFYKMYGHHFGRTKSSLTSKQVKTDPAFQSTMKHAAITGQASALASTVYSSLPDGWKLFELFQRLTGSAIRLLRENKTKEAIITALWAELEGLGFVAADHCTPADDHKLPPNLEAWLLAEPIRASRKEAVSNYHVGRNGTIKQAEPYVPDCNFDKSTRKVDIYVKSPKFRMLEELRLFLIIHNIRL